MLNHMSQDFGYAMCECTCAHVVYVCMCGMYLYVYVCVCIASQQGKVSPFKFYNFECTVT